MRTIAAVWIVVCISVAAGAVMNGSVSQYSKRSVTTHFAPATFSTGVTYEFQSIAHTRDLIVGLTTVPTHLIAFSPPSTPDAPIQVLQSIRLSDATNDRLQSSPAHSVIALGTASTTQLIDVQRGSSWTFAVDQNITTLNPARPQLAALESEESTLQLTLYTPDQPTQGVPLPHTDFHTGSPPAIAWQGDGNGLYLADEHGSNQNHTHEGDITNTLYHNVTLHSQRQSSYIPFTAFRINDQPGATDGYHLLLRAHDATESPETFDSNGDGMVGTFYFALSKSTNSSTAVIIDHEFTAQTDMVHCTWTTTEVLTCVAQWKDANNTNSFMSRTVSPHGITQHTQQLPKGFDVQQAAQGITPDIFALLEATTQRLYLIRVFASS